MLDSPTLLPLIIALPLLAGLAVGALGNRLRLANGWIIVAAAALATGCAWVIGRGDAVSPQYRLEWLPSINVAFALRGDGYGLFFAMLVTGIGTLVALYALSYLPESDADRAQRFYAALGVFMGAMVGIALADDLIVLFVFWEITSLSSFLLIGHRCEDATAKAGAVTALQVTALGGLVMSVGFLLLGQIAGTFSISTIAGDPQIVARIVGAPLGTAALLLILCGAFTKSAQVPFHFWLPGAMVAPTPISAYLHAATMVKAGVFLVGRMEPIFGTAPLWLPVLVGIGALTMLLGAYHATRQRDLKAMLAYTTASALGSLFVMYGLRGTALDGLQILNHALYKGALFLVVGIVEHHTHTRSIDRLGGLRHALPLPFAAALLASLSMAGIPPLLGFIAKESSAALIMHHGVLSQHPLSQYLLMAAVTISSALLTVTAYRVTVNVFLGPARVADHTQHHERDTMWLSPLVLATGALLLGLAGAGTFTAHLTAAIASRPDTHAHVSLIPHVGIELALWAATLLLAAVFTRLPQLSADHGAPALRTPTAAEIWNAGVTGIASVGDAFSRTWENGSLRWYLAGTVLTLPALVAITFAAGGISHTAITAHLQDVSWIGLLFCALLAFGALATVRAQTRLAAAIASSSVGFLVAMLYVVYRSPDILLTQILIETVSTIFVLLVLLHLPGFPQRDLTPPARMVNATIAGSVGLVVTMLLLLAMTPGLRETDNIATRAGGLLSQALAIGGGANAVNVIIVDIRALDTNGEITVLVVVGLCVVGLLRTRRTPT